MVVRMPMELKRLLDKTADHIGRDLSFIARAVLRTMERCGSIVIQIDDGEMYNKEKSVLVCFRNIEMPSGMTHDDFRNTLYARCKEALSKPGISRFKPSLFEGRDYFVIEKEE